MPAPPALFPDGALAPGTQLLDNTRRSAEAAVQTWLRKHPARDDQAFTAFALGAISKPAAAEMHGPELAQLRRIAATRSPAGDSAAAWLERYGKKSIWKLYAKQYGQQAPKARAKLAKKDVKQSIKLAQAIVAQALPRFHSRAPYEVDPKLADFTASADQKGRLAAVAHGGAVRYSFPSKHAADIAAASAVLESFEPHRRGEFEWMADEVAYSRLYAGGHFPSDVRAGAFLGYMVAAYALHTQ